MQKLFNFFKKDTLFQKVFEVSNRPIIISTIEGKYLFVNSIYTEMRRCSRESLLNKYWWETFSNGELARRVKNTHLEISKRVECSYNAGYNIGIEGSLIIEWESRIIYSDEYKSDVIIEFGRDVSEKMKLKSQLIRMKKLDNLGTLAGGIAREYNNIHTGILSNISLLKNIFQKETNELNLLQNTQNLSFDAVKLTSKLLSFVKKSVCSDRLLDLNDIVKDVYDIVRKSISWKINIDIDLVESKNYILADYDQIFQSLMNLIVNATDSMSDEGEILLSTYITYFDEDKIFKDEGFIVKKGAYFSISIKDTGHGIDEKTKKKIFEPFYTTKDKQYNEGIGMSLVYCVVKSNNGFLFVKSRVNIGTTITSMFPIPLNDRKPLKKVLLTYNDQVLSCMEMILTRFGYNIKRLSSLEQTLKISSKDAIDIIIIDLNILEPLDDEIISRIKSKNAEIIIMTDSVEEEKINKLNLYKIKYVLFKPFKMSHLIELIESI